MEERVAHNHEVVGSKPTTASIQTAELQITAGIKTWDLYSCRELCTRLQCSGAAIAGNIIIIMQHMVSIQSSWCKCGKHASLKTTGDTDSTSVLEISLFDGLGSVVKTRKEETSDNSRSR